jgi:hypothetical protein
LTQYSSLIFQIYGKDFLSDVVSDIVPENLETVQVDVHVNELEEKLNLFKYETVESLNFILFTFPQLQDLQSAKG